METKLSKIYILKTITSLKAMISEMLVKKIDLSRITKTASLLCLSGVSLKSVPSTEIVKRCLMEQNSDGGWVGIKDTMWNIVFLSLYNKEKYNEPINKGIQYLENNLNQFGLWGYSSRDIPRIPVSGAIITLIPELQKQIYLERLEHLWKLEINSITYKAGYVLMAFAASKYKPNDEYIISNTIKWLISNQREDGGFAPWRTHPIQSNIFCTAISILGLVEYVSMVPSFVIEKALAWLENNQLKSGIWAFHEIEDGSSWGLYSLKKIHQYFLKNISDEKENSSYIS